LFEPRQKRLLSQWSAGVLVGTQQSYVLFSNHSGEESTPVGGQVDQGSHSNERVVLTAHVGGGATPPVIFITKERRLPAVSPPSDVKGQNQVRQQVPIRP